MRTSQALIARMLAPLAVIAATATYAAEPGPMAGQVFPHELAAADQMGKQQTLKSLMGEKGLAIFFVRSADWCPFCMRQLVDANQRLARFRELGINMVSVSVDEVAKIAAFATSQKIGYTMLADPKGAINLELGIRDEQYPVGSAQFGVPRPIIFVLDGKGTIRLRYMEPTHRTRPDLEKVLNDIEALAL
jgi:peroxiredoxin